MLPRFGLIMAFLFVAGCSKRSDADLHAVKGTVTRNGQPVKLGYVRFMPTDGRDVIVGGDVDINGRFELETLRNNKKKKGAPLGTYTVTYMAPTAEVNSTTTNKRHTIEGKSNDLTVELVEK